MNHNFKKSKRCKKPSSSSLPGHLIVLNIPLHSLPDRLPGWSKLKLWQVSPQLGIAGCSLQLSIWLVGQKFNFSFEVKSFKNHHCNILDRHFAFFIRCEDNWIYFLILPHCPDDQLGQI